MIDAGFMWPHDCDVDDGQGMPMIDWAIMFLCHSHLLQPFSAAKSE